MREADASLNCIVALNASEPVLQGSSGFPDMHEDIGIDESKQKDRKHDSGNDVKYGMLFQKYGG